MNAQKIRQYINDGFNVCWKNDQYRVVKTANHDQLFVLSIETFKMLELTFWNKPNTMCAGYNEEDFAVLTNM